MFWGAKGGHINIDDTEMEYISFGQGTEVLIIIPGLGDGLTTLKGKAILMALAYREYANAYKVYFFSRKNHMKENSSTRDMAKDQAKAMKILGISKANILGVSQGGMIAQYLAIDYPDLVNKLILAITTSETTDHTKSVLDSWVILAKQGNYEKIMIDTAEKSYSENYLKKHKLVYPLLGKIGKPKDFSRFLIQAYSCIKHNAYNDLGKIACPTLVIGGKEDKIIYVSCSFKLADRIKGSELYIYNKFGHALYEEAKDFNKRIIRFLIK